MVEKKEIVIIGAGAAGVGMGVTLTELGMSDFVILEKKKLETVLLIGRKRRDLLPLLLQVMGLVCLI